MKKLFLSVSLFVLGTAIFAQTVITGHVKDSDFDFPISNVAIKTVGKSLGVKTDFEGNYTLTVNQKPPFDIEFSLIGYESKIVSVTTVTQTVNVILEEFTTNLDELVLFASRIPERISESPVTIERLDAKAIKNSTSPDFYSGLENLRGINVSTNSLLFKTINTKGFTNFSNKRFLQLVDGMDNSSPALNFALGNLLGVSELDVESVEIIPGASSALYGANAFNGALFMTSKNPFVYQGISAYVKSGITSQKAAGNNEFYDVSVRAAHAFSEKFAAKASFSYIEGEDWWAVDDRDYNNTTRQLSNKDRSAPDYNGLNVYGDEVAVDLNYDEITSQPVGTFGTQKVSRTGFEEGDLTDYKTNNAKFDVALHVKPFENDFEIIWNSRLGSATSIYQGANRYSLDRLSINQHKLEITNDDFYVRGYVTSENAGDAHDLVFSGINLNRKWKSDKDWFTDYGTGYLGLLTGQILAHPALGPLVTSLGLSPGNVADANLFARMMADNRLANGTPINPAAPSILIPGTDSFDSALATVKNDPNLLTGSKFKDNSKTYHVDGNYNFKSLLNDATDVQVGGSYRVYALNSGGSLFTDATDPISIDEYGAYLQASKKVADEKLKLTASVRYDKSKNFEGNFSPRLSVVYSVGNSKDHNIRVSYQTGFRNPSTQEQYVGLDVGYGFLVGSVQDNFDRYTTRPLNVNTTAQNAPLLGFLGIGASTTLSGARAFDNAFTLTSVQAFGTAFEASGIPNPALLKKSKVEEIKPENVTAYELGYRGKLGKVSVDLSGYYNNYTNFIDDKSVIVPFYGKTDLSDAIPGDPNQTPIALSAIADGNYSLFAIYTNSPVDIVSYGLGIGVSGKLGKYDVGFNYTWSDFEYDQSVDPDFFPEFNTPEHKINLSFGNTKLFKNFGFNLNGRYNTEYLWQGPFAHGTMPERVTADAQINYSIPKIKSIFKVGGANIGGEEYQSAIGTGNVGTQYFVSWTINP